jgi:hypothetical protein
MNVEDFNPKRCRRRYRGGDRHKESLARNVDKTKAEVRTGSQKFERNSTVITANDMVLVADEISWGQHPYNHGS